MRRILYMFVALAICIASAGCHTTAAPTPSAAATATETITQTPESTPEPSPTPVPSTPEPTPTDEPTEAPTPAPTPTPVAFVPDKADKAGGKGVLFDIYKTKALADLTGDGKPDRIEFKAAKTPYLAINGKKYVIKNAGLAQVFAITDVDKKDKYLEIVLTDRYDSGLADSEKAFSYLYWWDGKTLYSMGKLMDVKFDGKWRKAFHASTYFNRAGQVTCLARTTEFTDIWYMAHFKPTSSKRVLNEAPYVAKLVNEHGKLRVLTSCLLLKNITTKYFKTDGLGLYDPASWPHSDGRLPVNPATADYTVIAQMDEYLTIVGVYGPNWYKLKTADGRQGWIKVIDGKMQGYWQVMHWTVNDIFEGIVVAG